MSDKRFFVLAHPEARRRATACVQESPDGYRVTIEPPKRTDGQNDRFHAMCGDLAKSGLAWAGSARTATQWKFLLISGHAKATGEEFEMVPGLEGEFLNIRESTAQMSIRRGASLIEYTRAFGDMHDVKWREPEK